MNFTPEAKPQGEDVRPADWVAVIKRARLDWSTKAIARILADYADWKNGRQVFPGIARLVVDTGASERTIKRSLAVLRHVQLIDLVKRGNRRRGHGDEYRLSLPGNPEAVGLTVLTPEEYVAEARRVAAAGAGDQGPVRHLIEWGDEVELDPPVETSGACVAPDEPEQGPVWPLKDAIRGHCGPPPNQENYPPSKSDPVVALGPELTTACAYEEEPQMPLSPDDLAELKRQGVRGAALVRAAREATRGERPLASRGLPPGLEVEPTSWQSTMALMNAVLADLSAPLAAEPGGVHAPVPPESQRGAQADLT